MQRVLTPSQLKILRGETDLLNELRLQISRLEASDEDIALLKRSLEQLDELFLLVVVGEFNAGKSAFLNSMLGDRLLAEGVTPTTAHINVLRYGDQVRQEHVGEDFIFVHLPVEWLHEINLVDTPGTNAVIQRHQQITEHFVPRSDLVLFVTSADRPFSESERAFLERIRQWGKKVVFVVNKMDVIDSESDRAAIVEYVRDNARRLLGMEPEIFPVSAKMALQAKQASPGMAPSGPLWDKSQMAPLEAYLLERLDNEERLRLKLQNPLGVAAHIMETYGAVLESRKALLKADFETLDAVDEQLTAYEEDMRRDYEYQFSRIDNVLYAMAERGDRFFDETMRLGRVFDLLNSSKVSADFEKTVVADTSREIERQVNSMIDWMVDKDFRQWRAISEYLNRRWQQHADRIVGQVGGDFESNRQQLLESVGREAQRIIDGYDQDAVAANLALEVQRSIVQTAAVEVGAIGLGALMVVLLHTTLLDVTGLLAAGAVAALGFYILPRRRAQLKAEMRTNIGELREKLKTALDKEFEQELSDSLLRIRDAIGPYTRFVRIERDKFEKIQAELAASRLQLESLRADVERMG